MIEFLEKLHILYKITLGFSGKWKEVKEDFDELEIFIDKEISNFWEDCLSWIFSKYTEWENDIINRITKSDKIIKR